MTLESYLDVRYDVKIYQPIKIDADQWRAITQGAALYRTRVGDPPENRSGVTATSIREWFGSCADQHCDLG